MLGSISDCESVSTALVQMKARTGALEKQQPDNPQNGNGFAGGVHRQMLINACLTELLLALLEDSFIADSLFK